MARSSKKLPYIHPSLLKKVLQMYKDKDTKGPVKNIKTWARGSTIIETMIGMTIEVHNGKLFIPVKITPARVGHKLGEFSPTRKFGGHPIKKEKEQGKKGTGKK